jgi:hypothetical protein
MDDDNDKKDADTATAQTQALIQEKATCYHCRHVRLQSRELLQVREQRRRLNGHWIERC